MDPTTGALLVAALGVLSGPVTAWLSFRWGREQERERRANERDADAERWQREERRRRVLRGEEAAGRLLEAIDNTGAQFATLGGKGATQEALQPIYTEVRRLAELLTDDLVRDKMFQIASAIFYWEQATYINPNVGGYAVGRAVTEAGHDVLRAYLHERALPATERLDRLTALINDGGELRYGNIDPDELAELDPLGNHASS
jgi:hypothetical protein